MSLKLGELIQNLQGEIFLSQKVTGIIEKEGYSIVKTEDKEFETKLVINCAGLFSDKIAALTFPDVDVRIIPFRGEYYELKPEKRFLVKTLIYPVPDPNFPFLGVHFTKMINGGVEAGPNAVFAFKREGYNKTSFDANDFLAP
jgi:L-2-hydroxyglutarate oxidase